MTIDLLTLEEVAALFKVQPRTIRRQHDAGKFPPALRIGSALRWNREAIEAWIAQGGGNTRRSAR